MTDANTESDHAARRMRCAGGRPLCLADWSRVLFVHYAIEPSVLQPHVPFPLDLFDGKAYVSLVAFTQHNVRPQFTGHLRRLGRRVAAWCAKPVTAHTFLNLRTYVRHQGERGIYFIAEWIPNRVDRLVGPAAYGLPYRLGRLRYDYAANGLPRGGSVWARGAAFAFDAHVESPARFAPSASRLDRFLLERYTAYTRRGGTLRRFRIWHASWAQAPASVTTHRTDLLEQAAPWFGACRFAGANFSPGAADVRIGPPFTLRRPRRGAVPTADAAVYAVLATMPALALCLDAPRWALMWAVAFALFFACKWVTWRRASRHFPAGRGRALGYLLGWVGMDAPAFLGVAVPRPAPSEWVTALSKSITGAAMVWGAARLVPPHHPLLAGWVGMIGLALLLHFGTFHLLALAWRRAGVNAVPIMREPFRSKSLAEFWSVRWNRGFHRLAHDLVFRPCVRLGVRPPAALLATFLASGLVHESVISLPAGGGWGLPTLYFAVQGAAVVFERSTAGRRLGLARGARGRFFALACAALPLPCLFPPTFVRRVAVPFLAAIGAF